MSEPTRWTDTGDDNVLDREETASEHRTEVDTNNSKSASVAESHKAGISGDKAGMAASNGITGDQGTGGSTNKVKYGDEASEASKSSNATNTDGMVGTNTGAEKSGLQGGMTGGTNGGDNVRFDQAGPSSPGKPVADPGSGGD